MPLLPVPAPLRPNAPAGADAPIAVLEPAVQELMCAYKDALKFADSMPLVGRFEVEGGRRWGSRAFTKAYLELHVRKQIQTIRSAVTMELFGNTAADERERIGRLDAELGQRVAPLLRWRRLGGLFARLPPVAVALPLLSALSVWPVDSGFDLKAAVDAMILVGGSVLLVWLLVVWPSLRLGFRVKRVILAGGKDFAHPFFNQPGSLQWHGFRERKLHGVDVPKTDGDKLRPFPKEDVYKLENGVFELLGRRKPTEVPLDMVFGGPAYVLLMSSALVVVATVDLAASGFPGITGFGWFGLGLMLFTAIFVPFKLGQQAVKNSRKRPH